MKYPDKFNESPKPNNDTIGSSEITRADLQAKCENCFGLCCIALCFSASEGFPSDKFAGEPCINLLPDYRCSIHENLGESGLKGCMAFDCFGAGQKLAQTYGGIDWRKNPQSAPQMFEVFLIMRQLHEMLWYLTEALTLQPAGSVHDELSSIYDETKRLTNLSPDLLVSIDAEAHRAKVSTLLRQACELGQENSCREPQRQGKTLKRLSPGADLIGADLRKTDLTGTNLRGAYLIAADLRGTDLSGAVLIGADLRDADLSGTDLTHSIFLTQFQINTAKGDSSTQLPPWLTRPLHWNT